MKRTTGSQIGLGVSVIVLVACGLMAKSTGVRYWEMGIIAGLTFGVYFILEYSIVSKSTTKDKSDKSNDQ